jgi:excinuclease ABC subunit B
MKFDEFEKSVNQLIYVSATPADYELNQTKGAIVEQLIRPTGLLDPNIELYPTEGQIDHLIGEVRKVVAKNERVLVTTLTKRMAEDLTDYLKGVNIRAEYMHSDIKTIERVSILRGLRMQEFDVLVGINLLREGLDLPEVSLVVVLDADKEGFLRSRSSLLQVAGRAARNVNGRVILYGDKITDSMQNLMDETIRRREIQHIHNEKEGITPQTIYKSVDEIRLSTAVADAQVSYEIKEELNIDVSTLDGMETKELLEQLKRKMQRCAKDLQFEQAAILRDEIEKIESNL